MFNAIKLSLSKYKAWIYVAVAIFLIGFGAYAGITATKNQYELKIANMELDASKLREENEKLKTKAAEKSVETVTKYVDRVKIVREKGQTITKEVPVYVTKQANEQCKLTEGFVGVHDAAAKNEPPKKVEDVNKPVSNTLSEATGVVTENYTKFHETRQQLLSLQEWVKTQAELINGKGNEK